MNKDGDKSVPYKEIKNKVLLDKGCTEILFFSMLSFLFFFFKYEYDNNFTMIAAFFPFSTLCIILTEIREIMNFYKGPKFDVKNI